MNKSIAFISLTYSLIVFSLNSFAQAKSNSIALSNKTEFETINRNRSIVVKEKDTVIHLDAKESAGIAWIKNIHFTTGIIEFDVKGKDVLQESFVGIAFHGVNDTTYDAVYFRPFNFRSADTNRKNHSVQYISLPKYDWPYLRETFPNKYEQALKSDQDANQCFHVKIVVTNHSIETFINKDTQPSLVVKPLSNHATGRLGFWVGNGSDGDFTNLVIQQP